MEYQTFEISEFSPESGFVLRQARVASLSVWGHFAGIGLNTGAASFIDQAISDCLAK